VAGALVVGVLLGYLGWTLPTVGASLFTPTLVVFLVGAGVAGAAWVVACFRPQRRAFWVFSVGVGVLTLVASAWTLEFALPASLAWQPSAAHRAQALLAQLKGEPGYAHGVAPAEPCTEVTTGSIGPLRAPYSECPVWTPEGHFVQFSTPRGGLTYTNVGAFTFEDQCYRHLVGWWWMDAPETNGIGGCPFGYRFRGGG
jgi:hypothetical protein